MDLEEHANMRDRVRKLQKQTSVNLSQQKFAESIDGHANSDQDKADEEGSGSEFDFLDEDLARGRRKAIAKTD